MSASPRGAGLLAVGLGLAFVASAVLWSSHSAMPLHWGDACVSAGRVLESSDRMALLRGLDRWTSVDVWTRTSRAPLMLWLGLLWIRLPGLEARHLELLPAVLLGIGGALTSLAVSRSRRSLAAGTVAGLILLGSLQAAIQAHAFFLSTAALLFTGLALLGLEGLDRGRRLAPLWLGLGLGGALLSRHNAAASLVLPVLLWSLPGLWHQLRRAPLGLLSGAWLLPPALLAGALLAHHQGDPERWLTTGPLVLLLTLVLAPAATLLGRPASAPSRALWLGAALSTPWWLGHHALIAAHLAGSDAGQGSRSTTSDLLSFMAQVIGLQQLGLVLIPLGLVGLLLALLRLLQGRRDRLEAFSLLALGLAFALCRLYFHSRYLLPLLPFVAVLTAATVPTAPVTWARRLRLALPAVVALLALSHQLGWLVGLPAPPTDYLRDEHKGWIERSMGIEDELRAPWLQPLLTVPPVDGPDVAAQVFAAIGEDCPTRRRCNLRVPQPPTGMLGLSTFDDWGWLRWQLLRSGLAWRLDLLDRGVLRGRSYVLLLRQGGEGRPPEVEGSQPADWSVLWEPRAVEGGTVELWVTEGAPGPTPPGPPAEAPR